MPSKKCAYFTYHSSYNTDKDKNTGPEVGNEDQGDKEYTDCCNQEIPVQLGFKHLENKMDIVIFV